MQAAREKPGETARLPSQEIYTGHGDQEEEENEEEEEELDDDGERKDGDGIIGYSDNDDVMRRRQRIKN